MALGQTDLDRLERAMANGTLTVEVDGQRITYRSVSELREAIDYTRRAISDASSGGSVGHSFASHKRG